MRRPALRARGVSVRIGAATLLDSVSLDVHAGELVALVGPNGAGKSTLLSVLTGDLTPFSGTVDVHGRPVTEWTLGELARERAVLTQEHRVAFPFPVGDVVRMGRNPWRGTPAEDLDDLEVAAAMHDCEVTHLAQRRLPTCSGGEKARTALARVLAQRTGILLLDEPTAALDLGHSETVLARVRARVDAGAAGVIVVHDLNLAAAWADRVVLLDRGQTVADGGIDEVLTSDLLSRVYEHPVEVLRHPVTGGLLVLPDRITAARQRLEV
ncbi:heme ABC transporter ATP-binding protein [Nocardioides limicola]|uniref:heme ABC transporter ATP-binding protein n=1 Tax=Nocardioides limicola TaxID=2803368 RepID=UPI00193AF41C|nr:heme ABC transporter ATP-binding protein [Nocardioides sp. DJM-14]